MAKLVDSKEAESFGLDLEEIGRSIRSSFQIAAASSRRSSSICSTREEDDEYELKWAAVERLPTFERIRTSVLDHYSNGDGSGLRKERRVIDVTKLGGLERHLLIENLIKHIENDNLQLLCVEAQCEVVEGKPLPTLWNTGVNGLSTEQRKRLTIAVELVSNPSIIFMDEPTSGLDARAAAIVMRAVKNVAETGRTVVGPIGEVLHTTWCEWYSLSRYLWNLQYCSLNQKSESQ